MEIQRGAEFEQCLLKYYIILLITNNTELIMFEIADNKISKRAFL